MHEEGGSFEDGDQSPNPWNLSLWGQNVGRGGKPSRRSDTGSGARVPFLESPILRPGKVSIALRPGLSAKPLPYFHCRSYLRHGINQVTLTTGKWLVLK